MEDKKDEEKPKAPEAPPAPREEDALQKPSRWERG